ncbi:energy-coupling factor transporter transmembrane component T [Peptacetobacter sp.]|uniref:energy-coupling factor transporter transmembrane component T n=1 Tax=Peptacetobacter sp. TaxID=2991975 RepID=UPI00262C0EFC|nr:energy-coupling factor transporter transmembrane component T [Peptacetobacter sp.]
MRDKVIKIDFRTKLAMTVVLSYILLLGNLQQKFLPIAIFASALPYFFLMMEKEYKTVVKGFILILIALFIQVYYMGKIGGLLNSLFLFISMIVLKMLPGLMMGKYALTSTNMSEITISMKKMKFPDEMIIPITVMARFFQTVKEDYSQIKSAMYLHGLTIRKLIFHPIKFVEYRIIPLLMILTKTADDISISAMTRGMQVNKKRTYLYDSKFCIFDYICFSIIIILISFYIGGKYA